MLGLACAFAPLASDVTGGQLHRYEASRLSMACVYAIDMYGPDERALPRIATEALDEVDRIDRLMSHYKADSPLSHINRDAARQPVVVDQELFDFIAEAIRYSRESHGAFDITVGPLMKAWGFFNGEGRVPSPRVLAAARRSVGSDLVVLNERARSIRFLRDGVELDLGGIAKGYAVDQVIRLLRDRGVSSALVSAGGSTIYGLGAPPDGDAWEVAVQDPIDSRRTALTLRVKNRALSVAGRSEKWFEADGVKYSHIMDPRTGRPVQGVLTVVVLAETGTAGDALDDALFVLGPKASQAYLDAHGGKADAFFFLPDSPRGWRMVEARQTSSRRTPS